MHITGTVEPMLATLTEQLPSGGGWLYEPKWDGYRALAHVDGEGRARLFSRRQKPLQAFPEIVAAVAATLPASTVVDGEIVRWGERGRLDFAALQQRNPTRGATARRLAAELPCHFLVFDALEVEGEDLRDEPLRVRRGRLEQLLADVGGESRVVLGMVTDDVEQARGWLETLAPVGVEGVVAKRSGERYQPGRRAWYKVKSYASTEFIIGGVTGRLDRPEHLILGRYSSETGTLVVAGRTVPLRPPAAAEVAGLLTPAGEDHPWPDVLPPGWHSREPTQITRVVPEVVIEARVDVAQLDDRWRHGVRYLRPRADVEPADVPQDLDLE